MYAKLDRVRQYLKIISIHDPAEQGITYEVCTNRDQSQNTDDGEEKASMPIVVPQGKNTQRGKH